MVFRFVVECSVVCERARVDKQEIDWFKKTSREFKSQSKIILIIAYEKASYVFVDCYFEINHYQIRTKMCNEMVFSAGSYLIFGREREKNIFFSDSRDLRRLRLRRTRVGTRKISEILCDLLESRRIVCVWTVENSYQGEKCIMSKVAFGAVIIARSGIPWNGWISQLVSFFFLQYSFNDFVVDDDSCLILSFFVLNAYVAKSQLQQSHFRRFVYIDSPAFHTDEWIKAKMRRQSARAHTRHDGSLSYSFILFWMWARALDENYATDDVSI